MKRKCLSARQLERCGQQKGWAAEENGNLSLSPKSHRGVFVSRTYDSGKAQTQWNRMVLSISRNAVFHAYVWLFDRKGEGEEADAAGNVEKCLEYIKKRAQYHSNYRDQLLYGDKNGRGRYAKFALEITREDENKDVVFTGYDLSFPKESFAAYLPAIYQGNLQLDRFLAVYQSIYLELEEKIDALAEQLDPECCGGEQTVRLAQWMGWGKLAEQVDRETLLRLLREGIHAADRKGTCGYYIELVRILLGHRAVLVEDPDRHRAVVLIKGRQEEGKKGCLEWLRKTAPLDVSMDFVFLHRTDRLDGQYFLDVTASVSLYESELREEGICVDNIKLQ